MSVVVVGHTNHLAKISESTIRTSRNTTGLVRLLAVQWYNPSARFTRISGEVFWLLSLGFL